MIISIIAPCRNEVLYIDKFIEAVLGQECKNFQLEIVIADGLSDDGTQEKLVAWACKETRLKVICNPGRIVSTGLNLALNNARGEIVVRMDIHTQYSKEYVSECVRSLSVTDAQCVGGPWVAFGYTPLQRAIAAAFQSSVGSGGAASRQIDFSGWVDTVYLGAWRKSYILGVGGFDEALVRNQDDELCLRIVRQGGRIYQSSTIRSVYIPRNSFAALFRQFSQYGYWKIPVIRKHHLPASIRHVAPFVFFAGLALVAGVSIFLPLAGWLLLVIVFIYTSALIIGTRKQRALLEPTDSQLLTLIAVLIMHLGYGVGFGRAIWDFWVCGKSGTTEMTQLTR